MLYETFSDTPFCTDLAAPGDKNYHAARELAADITKKMLTAYVEAVIARQRSEADPSDPILEDIADDAWEHFAGLQSLAYENPNVRILMAEKNLSHVLTAQDPAS